MKETKIYLDESGFNPEMPVCVVAGFSVIDQAVARTLRRSLEKIASDHLPGRLQSFHTTDIYRGKGMLANFEEGKRYAVIRAACNLICDAIINQEIKIVCGWSRNINGLEGTHENSLRNHSMALINLFLGFSKHNADNPFAGEDVVFIHEKGKEAENELKSAFDLFKNKENRIKYLSNLSFIDSYDDLGIDRIEFIPKHQERCLIVSDLICWVVRRKFSSLDRECFFDSIFPEEVKSNILEQRINHCGWFSVWGK